MIKVQQAAHDDFLSHLAPFTGDCAVNSDSISATLVSDEVPGTG